MLDDEPQVLHVKLPLRAIDLPQQKSGRPEILPHWLQVYLGLAIALTS